MLEATMILIDNSDHMRNADMSPSRFLSQADAVNLMFDVKTATNPENTVGLLSMRGPDVLVTLTQDQGKILSAMHNEKLGGQVDLLTSINVATLALKHRQNKSQKQRLVIFLGSPAEASTEELIKLAKKLKKNNVAVDLVLFGEETAADQEISNGKRDGLQQFIDTVGAGSSGETESHILFCQPGPMLLSDQLLRSPLLASGGSSNEANDGSGNDAAGGFEFGIDPSLDPELAMVLRMSMEEEAQRQAALAAAAAAAANPSADATASSNTAAHDSMLVDVSDPAPAATAKTEEDEEKEVEREISLMEQDTMDDDDEEASIARAIALSMEENTSAPKDPDAKQS